MLDRDEGARRYLAPGRGAFWRWSEDGEAIEWLDGGTIAFRAEVVAVLRRVAPTGLPLFDAVVLLMAMCSDDWTVRRRDVHGPSVESTGAEVPLPYRAPRHRPLLVEMVLAEVPVTPSPLAAEIVRALETGLSPELLESQPRLATSPTACLGLMHERLQSLTSARLALHEKTGLDELPRPADPELPEAERARRLIASMEQDRDLGGIAALARDTMAAVHLPRPVSEPEELPLGGVSEIANRGSLERLLMSELAQDDDTLMVRIALGEALYVRREAPPQAPGGERRILVDCGIRQWGTPRVFAAAVALAVAARSGDDLRVRAFRATADDIAPVDLTRREGMIELLESLELTAHPGASLARFLEPFDEQAPAADAILITHEDALEDPGLVAALEERGDVACYAATVNRHGALALWSIGSRGRKLLRRAQLDIAKLLPQTTWPVASSPEALPAILAADPFPLLMPYTRQGQRVAWSERIGWIEVTRDGRLLQALDRDKGARQVSASLPPGRPRLVHVPGESSRVVVLIDAGEELELITLDVETGATTRRSVDRGLFLGAFFAAGDVVIVTRNGLRGLEPSTGLEVGRTPHRGLDESIRRTVGREDRKGWMEFDGSPLAFRRSDPRRSAEPPSRHTRTGPALYHSLKAVEFDPGGLCLVTWKDRRISFRHRGVATHVGAARQPRRTDPAGFEPVGVPGCGFGLAVARSPSGNRCYFDSRGLVHLVPVDGTQPELSLVLVSTGRTAAWSSSGDRFGNRFFFDGAPGPDEEFRRLLSRFAETS